jgi:hypothetical protein
MSKQEKIRRRIRQINWSLAVILAINSVITLWLVFGGWPLAGWLDAFSARYPIAVASVAAIVFAIVLIYNRPLPEPAWASPDVFTVRYGLGVVVLVTTAVTSLAVLRILNR